MSLKCETCKIDMKCHKNAEPRTMEYSVRCPMCKSWYDISNRSAFQYYPKIVRSHFGRQKNVN